MPQNNTLGCVGNTGAHAHHAPRYLLRSYQRRAPKEGRVDGQRGTPCKTDPLRRTISWLHRMPGPTSTVALPSSYTAWFSLACVIDYIKLNHPRVLLGQYK